MRTLLFLLAILAVGCIAPTGFDPPPGCDLTLDICPYGIEFTVCECKPVPEPQW